MKELRIGMVGYGFMGRAHSNAYKRLTDFFPVRHKPVLKAVCARDAAKAKAFADNWGYERVETDWRKLVSAGDIDAVDICTPNDLHQEIAIAAAKAGKMILCEKPLARTAAEAEPMVKAVEEAKVPNMVWYNYRRVPAISLAKQLIDEGRLGRTFHFRANFLQDWTIAPDVPQGGAALWRLDAKAAGSGVTGDLLAHNIDTAMWLNGPITRVTAKTETFVKERMHNLTGKVEPVGIDDACLFICEFANGSLGLFESTRYARGHKALKTFEVNGAGGSVRFDLEEMEYLDYFEYKGESHVRGWRRIHVTNGEHPYMNRYWVPGLVIGYEHSFLNALADFVTGLETGTPAQPDFRNALQTQKVCDAVLESARTGAWVATGVAL
ncbi:MAG: Gfo/Idh/MocA family oxidoreductase [Bryobacterales bacterium]|nr:Gfo/Idh/MocA family oxidoreductase [Bryobacterales bacterium]